MFAASKTASVSGGYQISRSLRFNSADSAYLDRTPASAGNRKTWTWSAWVKRGALSGSNFFNLFEAYAGASDTDSFGIRFTPNDILQIWGYNSSWRETTAVYRDASAWYHIVVAVDTTQATANDRIKLYVNGVQVTAFSVTNNPTLNSDTGVDSTGTHYIGRAGYSATWYFSGYQTDVYLIDGQALTPSSFGETNAQTGVWSPKAYSGSYGTNGFYLNFSDNSNTTAATLGKDYSGNGNNWTPNNFSVTAGAGNDSLVDSPTSYGTDTGVGGTVRGNYATLNPISLAGGTFTNGNLDWASPTTDGRFCLATIPVNFMNCYCEVTIGSATSFQQVGVYGNPTTFNPRVQYRSDGQAQIDGVVQATYASYTANDIIGMSYNSSTGSVSFYKNGTLQGSMTVTSTSVTQYFAAGSNSSGAAANYTFNFGQRPFAYTAPSGFKALCTQNLPTPTIGATTATQAGKYFNTVLYTGTQTTQSVTGVGFQPDFVWNKDRSGPWPHVLTDVVRGVGKSLYTNSTDPEVTNDANGYLSAFNSDGFTLAGGLRVNASGDAIVAWNWKANGSGSTNTAGSITSTVSANTTSGFSIVNWTGSTSGSAQTVGHGLGVTPSMVILKNRSTVDSWYVYFSGATTTSQYLTLNGTGAVASAVGIWGAGMTSTLVGVKPSVFCASTSDNVLMYCFAEVAGYSKFGSYTGNGSADGPFVFTGMRPAYIMVKRTNSSGTSWNIFDTTRSPYNVTDDVLFADLSNAEVVNESTAAFDVLSNGFKLRTTGTSANGSGDTYIYMAFASAPFKFSLGR